MAEDVQDLARRHRIQLTWTPSRALGTPESFPEAKAAIVPQITRGSDYLIALHELGHCLSRIARQATERLDPYGSALCEGAAWAWAVAAADPGLVRRLSAKDWNRAMYALRTHFMDAAFHDRQTDQRGVFMRIEWLGPGSVDCHAADEHSVAR